MTTDTPTDVQTPLRRSPLHDRHVAAGARMAEFAGWEMPIDYGSVVAEHEAVRGSGGMFDLTHLGTVAVTGPGAEQVIQRSFTNDVTTLEPGRSHYTLCLDADAGIIDDLLVYRLGDWFLVVPNAANTAAVTARLLDQSRTHDDDVRRVGGGSCGAIVPFPTHGWFGPRSRRRGGRSAGRFWRRGQAVAFSARRGAPPISPYRSRGSSTT